MNKMSPFGLLISYEEALALIDEHTKPTDRIEEAPIEEAVGRVLAVDLVAEADVPGFDRAAMDGYALRAQDTFEASPMKPRVLKLIEVVQVGESAGKSVGKGECTQVSTGCLIPRGADAVVMVEYTERSDEDVVVKRPVYPKANIAPRGEDIEKGETILERGNLLTPAKVGVLAALGRRSVQVYARPRVAVIPTGKELLEPGTKLEDGQIYDVNSYTLVSIISINGGVATRFEVVPDTTEDLKKAVKRGLDYDFIVFSGGSSVGERDLLYAVIKDLGTILFHGVQIKPGKPTLFATVEGKPVFGMPGYPTSCLSNAYLFLVPTLRKMARLPERSERKVKARLAKRIVSASGRKQFLPVKLREGLAYPVFKESGDITSMAGADGYLLLPVNVDVLEEGREVEVILFD
mgnify:CR=1 FL=1